jgi:hypothetical protein
MMLEVLEVKPASSSAAVVAGMENISIPMNRASIVISRHHIVPPCCTHAIDTTANRLVSLLPLPTSSRSD